MTQQDRDRLVALKKAKRGLIAQRQAAVEIGQSEGNVRRLLVKLKRGGDRAVMHQLRSRPSNRQVASEIKKAAVGILSQEVYSGFGPTLASEYLGKEHSVNVSRETVRAWMIEAKLWRARKQRVEKIHQWRARRDRAGELVQWDTSEHAWLEERGPKLYLISMIDDATSRIYARFVMHDSTEQNMRLLWGYLERHGRPRSFYTDKAVTLEQANDYLGTKFIPWWNSKLCVSPACSDDAHRPLQKTHSLPSSLSYVEDRQVANDYTIQFDNKVYQIARSDIRAGMRHASVRVEVRLDGSLAVRFREHYLEVTECQLRPKATVACPRRKAVAPRLKSQWMKNFHLTSPETTALSAIPKSS